MAISRTEFIGRTYRLQGLCKGYVGGYTPKIWPYMIQYLHVRILEFPYCHVEFPSCHVNGQKKVYHLVIKHLSGHSIYKKITYK